MASYLVLYMSFLCLIYLADTAPIDEDISLLSCLVKYQPPGVAEQQKLELQKLLHERRIREKDAIVKMNERLKKEKELEEKARKEGILYKFMSKIPILKRFARDVKENKPVKEPLKEKMKLALGQAKQSFKEGVKTVGEKLWELLVPQSVQENWPQVKAKMWEHFDNAAVKFPLLKVFVSGASSEK